MRGTYVEVPQKYCEIVSEERAIIRKPAMDNIRIALTTVFWIEAASLNRSFPKLSEANFARALGRANIVKREKIEATKDRMDRTPRSVGVRAFVFVTMM